MSTRRVTLLLAAIALALFALGVVLFLREEPQPLVLRSGGQVDPERVPFAPEPSSSASPREPCPDDPEARRRGAQDARADLRERRVRLLAYDNDAMWHGPDVSIVTLKGIELRTIVSCVPTCEHITHADAYNEVLEAHVLGSRSRAELSRWWATVREALQFGAKTLRNPCP